MNHTSTCALGNCEQYCRYVKIDSCLLSKLLEEFRVCRAVFTALRGFTVSCKQAET